MISSSIAVKTIGENLEWLLAQKINYVRETYSGDDSRRELELLGFAVLCKADNLFYKVQPPEGWDRYKEGYWTYIIDTERVKRIAQFYKFKTAFLNILK